MKFGVIHTTPSKCHLKKKIYRLDDIVIRPGELFIGIFAGCIHSACMVFVFRVTYKPAKAGRLLIMIRCIVIIVYSMHML